jgi:CheY-like chemotaxis protein
MGNSTQIHQVLMNLCNNAYQAMSDGSGTIHIGLRILGSEQLSPSQRQISQNGKGLVVLTFSDDGAGIDETILGKIFDPFFSTKDVGKGTGLGLSVVHRIIDLHQGLIEVTSRPGQGTCFEISLPPADGSEENFDLSGSEQLSRGTGNILLVDDDPRVLESSAELLQHLGYQVQAFNLPAAALAYLKEHAEQIQILVTDQTMPVMTGLELIREARKIREKLPVVLRTGYSDRVDEQTAQELEIVFLMKPVSLPQFSKTLQDLLN